MTENLEEPPNVENLITAYLHLSDSATLGFIGQNSLGKKEGARYVPRKVSNLAPSQYVSIVVFTSAAMQ